MAGAASHSGLRCSHGSDLDTHIPRPKMPKRALPDCIRRQIKGAVLSESDKDDSNLYRAGSGVLAPVGSAPDGTFLKRNSGQPMSSRASYLAQQRGDAIGAKATIYRAKVINYVNSSPNMPNSADVKKSMRRHRREKSKADSRDIDSRSSVPSLPPISKRQNDENQRMRYSA